MFIFPEEDEMMYGVRQSDNFLTLLEKNTHTFCAIPLVSEGALALGCKHFSLSLLLITLDAL
jgi:hypothetical protein